MAKQLLRNGCIALLVGLVFVTSACGTTNQVQTSSVPKQVQQTKKASVEAAGKIKAKDTKNILLDFSATVQSVRVKDGQKVNLGEELLALDMHEINQQIANKENDLKQSKLQLEISINGIDSAQKELQRQISENDSEKNNYVGIQLKENDYKNTQEEFNRANEDLVTKQKLFKASALSKNELDIAQRKSDDAEKKVIDKRLTYDEATFYKQQTLDRQQTSISQQISKINDQKLNVEIQKQKFSVLEADINLLKDKLNKSYIKENKIVSDFKNALVQDFTRVSGDYIQTNTKLLALVNMDSLCVDAEVSEDFIKDVKIGAEVEIIPLSDSTKIYKGHVTKIADLGIEKNGETIIFTEISFDKMDEFIKPNFSVDVKIFK